MRPSLRFLAVAVIGWAGIRAATLGMVKRDRLSAIQASTTSGTSQKRVASAYPQRADATIASGEPASARTSARA